MSIPLEARTRTIQPNESVDIQLKEPRKVRATAVEFAVSTPTFAANYSRAKDLDAKYSIAYALIEDGRYEDQLSLLHHFMPPRDVMAQLPVEQQQELITSGKEYKDSLAILLMQKGILDPEEDEAKNASDEINKLVDRNELLNKLRGALPIHVMGAITSALLFDSVSDQEKKEKLRGWTTKAMLRPYLGNLAVNPIRGDLDFKTLVDLVPEKIFQNIDSATMQMARYYFTNEAMKLFIDGEQVGFSSLRTTIEQEASETKREFLDGIQKEFEEVTKVHVPDVFESTLETWTDEESPFPHFRQKYFVHEFLKTKRKLLNGDTGGGKTASAFLAMEAAGAQKVTIFGPAKARNTWPREADKIFQAGEKPDVFAIRSAKDFNNPRIASARYVYVSNELMGQAWNNEELYSKIQAALIEQRSTDGVIFDESDVFRNEGAGCSKSLMDIVTKMREKYDQEKMFEMPMVALTATPIASSLKDLDITMALLYPERFALPKKYEAGKYPFSIQALKDPEIAYSLLFGEKLMLQWTLEDMYGRKAERFELNPEFRKKLVINPSERVIYDWVAGLSINSLSKTRLLRSTLLNPELIKKTLRERGLIPEPFRSLEEMRRHLESLYNSWMEWSLGKSIDIPDEPFSADWVAKYDPNFILECFFDNRFVEGIETLAAQNPTLADDWRRREAVSEKYRYIKTMLNKAIAKTEDGYTANRKIFLVSPYHKRGITRFIDDEHIKDADLEDNAWSLYEHIFTEWLPGLPQEMAVNIDGTRSFAFRDRHAKIWREEGNRDIFVVASQESINESMDWALRDTVDNKNIDKFEVINLGWSYSSEEVIQTRGRFDRPGRGKPFDFSVLEAEDTIDQGFYNLVRRKYLLSQIALAGIKLDKEDLEFFRSSSEAKRILLAQPSVGQFFLQDVIRKLKGRGEQEGIQELSQQKNGKTFFELFAEFYFDEGRDEFRIVGNNAELVKNIALRSNPRKIISVGAGSCLFARKLRESGYEGQIDNVDINGAALRLAKEKFSNIGNTNIEGASNLSAKEETYDLADYSFIIPWTKLYDSEKGEKADIDEIERVKVLLEMNKILKMGGQAILSFPESSFDEQSFSTFAKALTSHFGFTLKDPSGISHATDLRPNRRIGWVITVQKTDRPKLSGFQPDSIAFRNEGGTISQYKVKKEVAPSVVQIEYPIFSSRQFEVFNPLTKETVNANSTSRLEGTFYVSLEHMVKSIKEGLTDDQYRTWNIVRREVEEGLGRNYKEAEEVLAGILSRRGLDKASGWDEKNIKRIVKSEIRRMQRSN